MSSSLYFVACASAFLGMGAIFLTFENVDIVLVQTLDFVKMSKLLSFFLKKKTCFYTFDEAISSDCIAAVGL